MCHEAIRDFAARPVLAEVSFGSLLPLTESSIAATCFILIGRGEERLFVESRGGRSGGLPARHGRGDAKGEEPSNAVVVADWVGGHEAQLA
jgi:hypothetical protein